MKEDLTREENARRWVAVCAGMIEYFANQLPEVAYAAQSPDDVRELADAVRTIACDLRRLA